MDCWMVIDCWLLKGNLNCMLNRVVKIHTVTPVAGGCMSESVFIKKTNSMEEESQRDKLISWHDDSLLNTCSLLLIYCLLTAEVVSEILRQPLWAQDKHLLPLKSCDCCCNTGSHSMSSAMIYVGKCSLNFRRLSQDVILTVLMVSFHCLKSIQFMYLYSLWILSSQGD